MSFANSVKYERKKLGQWYFGHTPGGCIFALLRWDTSEKGKSHLGTLRSGWREKKAMCNAFLHTINVFYTVESRGFEFIDTAIYNFIRGTGMKVQENPSSLRPWGNCSNLPLTHCTPYDCFKTHITSMPIFSSHYFHPLYHHLSTFAPELIVPISS